MAKKSKHTAVKVENPAQRKGESRKILLPLLLLANTAIATVVYFTVLNYVRPEPVLIVYMTVFAAALIFYVCYNRGFFARNLTPDRLPDTMTAEQKADFIADVKNRERRSKWVVAFGFPFGFALLFDSLSWLAEDIIAQFTSFFG